MMAGESVFIVNTEMQASYVISGTEDSLADYRNDGWEIAYCSHNKDAGVICATVPIMLIVHPLKRKIVPRREKKWKETKTNK